MQKIKAGFLIFLLIFALGYLVDGRLLAAEKKVVGAIDVSGNEEVSSFLILSQVETKVGAPFSRLKAREDLKRIYALGMFSDVEVETVDLDKNQIKLIFVVSEKPIITELTIEGNKGLKTKKILGLIGSRQGEVLNEQIIHEDAKKIKAKYQEIGYHYAEVKTHITQRGGKRIVAFQIKEGRRVRIKKINFDGIKSFSARKLKKLMKTREKKFFNKGFFKEKDFEGDLNKLVSFYKDQGFLDAKIDSYKLTLGGKKKFLYITIVIEEGSLYHLQDLKISGNKLFPTESILQHLQMRPGMVYSERNLRENINAIFRLYAEKGYIFARVWPDIQRTKKAAVNIDYHIKEGELAYIEEILIEGNTKTKDIVIRRELKVKSADIFDGEKVERSREKLYNLGFFKTVEVDTLPGTAPNRRHLIFKVEEEKTGSFGLGAGYSSVDRAIGFVELQQRNFDLLNFPRFTGDGQDIKLRAEFGTKRKDYSLSFTEPWIFDWPLSFGFDIYRRSWVREEYDEERTGGTIRMGKSLAEDLSLYLTYKNETVKIGDLEPEASADIRAEEGSNVISSLRFSLVRDTRDNIFDPSRGSRNIISAEYAGGFLEGDKDFTKYNLDSRWFFTPVNKIVLDLRFRAGLVESFDDTLTVPIYERFYAGGGQTIRGYKEREVGPKDSNGDPIGGRLLGIGNIELTFPLIQDEAKRRSIIKGAIFCDSGYVWAEQGDFDADDLHTGVGLGVRLTTPIGPVDIDYGYPLDVDPGEPEEGRIHFRMGHTF